MQFINQAPADFLSLVGAVSFLHQLASLSFYAVLAYLLAREKSWLSQLGLIIGGLLLLLLLGLSPIYLQWTFVCVFLYDFRLYHDKVDHSALK